MTDAQRRMLNDLAAAPHGEQHIKPRGRRTIDTLARNGYAEWMLQGWARITPAGRERIVMFAPPTTTEKADDEVSR